MSDLNQALKLLRAGQEAQGLAALNLLADQGLPDARSHRACWYQDHGQLTEARTEWQAYLALRPTDALAVAYLARIHLQLGDLQAAWNACLDAYRLDPGCELAGRILHQTRAALGHGPAAAVTIESAPPPQAAPLNPFLQQMESAPEAFPGSVFPEVGRLLYTLVRMVRPKVLVETGSYLGYSGLCMAQALEDVQSGHLHCFDLFSPTAQFVSPVFGPIPDHLQLITRHFQAAGLSHRVSFHRGPSAETLTDATSLLGGRVDMAFIDGDHTINGCARDWAMLDPLLAPGSLVVLHDTEPQRCGWLGPRYLQEALLADAPSAYQVLNLPTGEGFGLGILQKQTLGRTELDWFPSLSQMLREVIHLRQHGKRRWWPLGPA